MPAEPRKRPNRDTHHRRMAFHRGRLAGIKTERGCSKCGYNAHAAALHFHHVDKSLKEFGPGNGTSRSWESIAKELEKCVVLCSNCHAEEEHADGWSV